MQLWFKVPFAGIAGELWSFWGQNFLNLLGFKIHFASKLAFKCNFGSKLVEVRRGTPALYRPLVFPSYNHPIPWQVLTFGEFILTFSLYEMSLDISNPCGNSRRLKIVLGSKRVKS